MSDKAQLIAEVGAFIDLIKSRPERQGLNVKETKELFDFWRRIYKEEIDCNACGSLVAEIYKNLKDWYSKNYVAPEVEIDVKPKKKKK